MSFASKPKENGIYDFVSKSIGVDEPIVERVWADHKWSGRWGDDLIEFMVRRTSISLVKIRGIWFRGASWRSSSTHLSPMSSSAQCWAKDWALTIR